MWECLGLLILSVFFRYFVKLYKKKIKIFKVLKVFLLYFFFERNKVFILRFWYFINLLVCVEIMVGNYVLIFIFRSFFF